MSDTSEFRYTTLVDPAEQDALAGIMDATGHLGEQTPPHWLVYFGVADTDPAVARVEELGGAVVRTSEEEQRWRAKPGKSLVPSGIRPVTARTLLPGPVIRGRAGYGRATPTGPAPRTGAKGKL